MAAEMPRADYLARMQKIKELCTHNPHYIVTILARDGHPKWATETVAELAAEASKRAWESRGLEDAVRVHVEGERRQRLVQLSRQLGNMEQARKTANYDGFPPWDWGRLTKEWEALAHHRKDVTERRKKRTPLTDEGARARRELIRHLWPQRISMEVIHMRVNADGAIPEWSEDRLYREAGRMRLVRPKGPVRFDLNDIETALANKATRAASANFAAAAAARRDHA